MSSHPASRRPGALSRRQAIRHFAAGTAASTLLGKPWMASLMAACEPVQVGAGILQVNVSDYPALQSNGGAVRLALNPFQSNSTSVSPFYPVLINRVSETTFAALSSRCTHQGCVVNPYDESAGGCVCPCHGSVFAIDGKRISGQANSALTKYRVEFDGQNRLCIEIPSLAFNVTASTVTSAVGGRVQLQFAAKRNLTYEVRKRRSLVEAGEVVPFSTALDSPAALNATTATRTGTLSLFVDPGSETEFFSVSVLVEEA